VFKQLQQKQMLSDRGEGSRHCGFTAAAGFTAPGSCCADDLAAGGMLINVQQPLPSSQRSKPPMSKQWHGKERHFLKGQEKKPKKNKKKTEHKMYAVAKAPLCTHPTCNMFGLGARAAPLLERVLWAHTRPVLCEV
jgi:hypothetical protein